MRSPRIPAQEQYRLIMECRRSGLTDHQWCVEHDIKPGTFYNWVKRLRQRGCADLPPATGHSYEAPEKQEVVQVNFQTPGVHDCSELTLGFDSSRSIAVSDMPVMQLSIGACTLSIPNGTDPVLLAQALRSLQEFKC